MDHTNRTSASVSRRFRSYETLKRDLICLSPNATLAEAAKLMRKHQVGTVIIIEDREGATVPVSIVTDRDVALQAEAGDLSACKIANFMNDNLTTAHVSADEFELVRLMKSAGVTRLPLVDDQGSLVGIVTAKKLLQVFAEGLSDLTQIAERQKQNERSHH
jgi:CBS domain-containing protein